MAGAPDITQPGLVANKGQTQRAEVLAEIERRRAELNLGLLRIYNYYRILVGLALMAIVAQDVVTSPLGTLNPDLFVIVALLYTAANIAVAIVIASSASRWLRGPNTSLAIVLFDVLALTLLMYASGGIGSGLAALVLISVAAGAILITGRRATLIAAAATLVLLYEESYLALLPTNASYDFFQAGIFGSIYFATSLSIQALTRRMRNNDIRAMTQAVELADLERLNRLILQRMRTGIVVVDEVGHVRMSNQSARALMDVAPDQELLQLPESLMAELNAWRQDVTRRAPPFRVSPLAPEIRVNFSAVRSDDAHGDVTVFLEDTAEIQQQAQQLKLAELGRLSASIAHEVRNPLGAISHAAQLLGESADLEKPDRRLTDIIINHCHRMNGVVENVLEMSRRKTPMPTRIQLRDHLNDFRTSFLQSLPEAQIDIQLDNQDTVVRVDPKQLDQVLTNLVDNGIRYSSENEHGQHVTLEGGVETITERPYLNVIDYGSGVDEELVATLFQPFSTSSNSGTGLGLYLARELCEANQAQLSYFRHSGGGSCFRILFSHPDRITA